MHRFEEFVTEGAPADLNFTVDKPADWVLVPLPSEEHDFTDTLHFAPVALLMAPYAAVVFTVAARPVYSDGTLAQWLEFVARARGLDPGTLEQQRIGDVDAVGCWGAQIENGMTMRARLVFFEDGERLVNVSCMAPDAMWSAFAPVFTRMLRTFRLRAPRGATVAIAPADVTLAPDSMAPVAPAPTPAPPTVGPLRLPDDGGDAGEPPVGTPASAVALAETMDSFAPEHALNARMREAGAGFVPNVLDYEQHERWATLAPGSVLATLRVPFGWHVIDDGKRTLVFDAQGHTQVSLQLLARQGRDHDAMFAAKLPELQRAWPAMQHLRTAVNGMPCLLVRGGVVDGKPIEQAYLLRDAPEDMVLQTRVTSSPERFAKAADLAEVLLRNLRFVNEPLPPLPVEP